MLFKKAPIKAVEPTIANKASLNLDALRDIRVELLDFQDLLTSIKKGDTNLKIYKNYVNETKTQVDELLKSTGKNDSIRHIGNIWEQISINPIMTTPDGQFSPEEQLHHINIIDSQIKKIIFEIGWLTIPERLNNWLRDTRAGYCIPFHLVFEDELPDVRDRNKLLEYLSFAPEAIKYGIVDSANGFIYKYSPDKKSRIISFVLLILGLSVSFFVLWFSSVLSNYVSEGWPINSEQLPTLLVGWSALIVGIFFHTVVVSAKRQKEGLPAMFPVRDVLLILDARLGNIISKLIFALIGLFGLIFTSGISNVTLLNAFLVGYSLDSFVALFETGAEQKAATQLATLKKQLSSIEK